MRKELETIAVAACVLLLIIPAWSGPPPVWWTFSASFTTVIAVAIVRGWITVNR